MIEADDFDLAELPQSLQDVVEHVGLSAALSLVERAGGTRVYVPVAMIEDHHLVDWLGHSDALRLIANFPGETISVPRCLSAMRAVRDKRIRVQRRAGERVSDLAIKYRLTERQVYTIIASSDDNTNQNQPSLL